MPLCRVDASSMRCNRRIRSPDSPAASNTGVLDIPRQPIRPPAPQTGTHVLQRTEWGAAPQRAASAGEPVPRIVMGRVWWSPYFTEESMTTTEHRAPWTDSCPTADTLEEALVIAQIGRASWREGV